MSWVRTSSCAGTIVGDADRRVQRTGAAGGIDETTSVRIFKEEQIDVASKHTAVAFPRNAPIISPFRAAAHHGPATDQQAG